MVFSETITVAACGSTGRAETKPGRCWGSCSIWLGLQLLEGKREAPEMTVRLPVSKGKGKGKAGWAAGRARPHRAQHQGTSVLSMCLVHHLPWRLVTQVWWVSSSRSRKCHEGREVWSGCLPLFPPCLESAWHMAGAHPSPVDERLTQLTGTSLL